MNQLHQLHDVFVASVGAAAALIGLLFVAISVAPEKIFGADADIVRRVSAERAFTALTNVFFVSFIALLPDTPAHGIQIVAAVSAVQTVRVAILALRGRPFNEAWRNTGLLSLVGYVLEWNAARLVPSNAGAAEDVMNVVLALYGYALLTSWGLLGAPPSAGPSKPAAPAD